MKKALLAMATALAIISCQQEELSVSPKGNTQADQIKLVEIINDSQVVPASIVTRNAVSQNLALQFSSEAVYQSFLQELKNMTREERINKVKAYGLTSLQEIAVIADEELEVIWNANESEASFRKAYEQYKQKYDGVLVANTYDSTDCTLYVPDGDDLNTYVANKKHSIVIKDKIQEAPIANDMSETDKLLFANLPDTRAASNRFSQKKEANKKKTVIDITLEASSGVFFHVGYQKKKALWWKRDNDRETYLKFAVSPTAFYFTYMGPNNKLINTNEIDLLVWQNQGQVDYWIGGIRPGYRSLSATVYLWTDITAGSATAQYRWVLLGGKMMEGDKNNGNKVTQPKGDPANSCGGSFTLYMP